MQQIKNRELEKLTEYQTGYKARLEALTEIKGGLEKWTRKLIDKNFFEQFKEQAKDGTDKWNKYVLINPEYSWARYSHRIYLGRSMEQVELQSRETKHVLEEVNKAIENTEKWITENQGRIDSVESTDEEALKNDLLAVFEKHNKPKIWREVLDSYEIKYPNED